MGRVKVHLSLSSETVATLRAVALDLGVVGPTGRHKGRGNLSGLLEFLARRIEAGHLRSGDLAQSRLFPGEGGRSG